jgi:hypothetical protein
MESSNMFRLKLRDLGLGLLVAVFTAVLLYMQSALAEPGFAWTNIDWLRLSNLGAAAGVAYLIKNALSDGKGNFLGIGGNK